MQTRSKSNGKFVRIVNWKGIPPTPHATAALGLGEWEFSVAPVGRLANRPKFWGRSSAVKE
jgi:hypothetical protein